MSAAHSHPRCARLLASPATGGTAERHPVGAV